MKAILTLSTLLLAAYGATVNADARNNSFYLGTGAGMYYVDIDGVDLDESAPTWRLFGGYSLNKYVSFEGGYSNLFEISEDFSDELFGDASVEMDGSSFDVMVRPTLPIGDQFEVFGVLGYAWYDFDFRTEVDGETFEDSDKDSELLYGVGGAWHFADRWSLRGEWTAVNVSDADFGMFTASVSYSFQ